MASQGTLLQVAEKHFLTIDQLSLHTSGVQKTQEPAPKPPLLNIFPPISPGTSSMLLFILLFFCALGLQLIRGVRGAKQVALAFIIALVVASIPAVLGYVQSGGGQQAKAGPQEVPKHVSVDYTNAQSVSITWETDIPSYGGVKYALVPFDRAVSRFRTADNGNKTKLHTTYLEGLALNRTYEFEILSGTNWYAQDNSYVRFTFTQK